MKGLGKKGSRDGQNSKETTIVNCFTGKKVPFACEPSQDVAT